MARKSLKKLKKNPRESFDTIVETLRGYRIGQITEAGEYANFAPELLDRIKGILNYSTAYADIDQGEVVGVITSMHRIKRILSGAGKSKRKTRKPAFVNAVHYGGGNFFDRIHRRPVNRRATNGMGR